MQYRPTLVALALTGALGLASTASMAQDDSSDQSGSSSSSGSSSNQSSGSSSSDSGSSGSSEQGAESSQSGNPFLRTVDEAYTAMRQVRAARLSIFEGETDTAKELVQAAMKDMESAQSMLDEFSMPSGQSDQSGGQSGNSSGSQQESGGGSGGNGQRYLPIDLSVGIAEGFLIPEDRTDALAQANAAFLRGDRRAATSILRDASIDVVVRATMIPAQKSLDNLKQADELMGQEKFYEANVALKAIEDSVTNRTFALDAMPRQGRSGGGDQGGQGGSGGSGGSQSSGG